MPPFKILAVVAAFCVSHGAGLTKQQAPAGTVAVDLTSRIGPTKFLGSGFIYGWPDNGTSADNSIPDYFATDIKFNACRAGGAQISAPGWAGGYDGYIKRFESALSNYRTTRKYGGDFILLPHDLWGADSIQGEGTAFPGDNGNWTEAELFLKQVANDLKENDMLEGLVFDIWNEPEIDSFWARSWEQYLEYYVWAHRIIRAELPATLISGPSAASTPSLDNEKWDSWLSTISTNDTIPDIYAWHQIGDENRELDRVVPDFNTLLAKHSLPERPIDINEYAWSYRQNPANSAFYLAQLERHNLRGLRANWGGGSALHDFMADLVFNNADGSYSPNGDWYLYKYYAQMVGERVATVASADYQSDVFAVVDGINVKVLAGTPTIQSNYEIKISGLSHLGLPSGGTVEVHSRRFDWLGTKVDVGEPVDLGVVSLDYSSDTLTILVQTPTNSTAFAFEFTGQN